MINLPEWLNFGQLQTCHRCQLKTDCPKRSVGIAESLPNDCFYYVAPGMTVIDRSWMLQKLTETIKSGE